MPTSTRRQAASRSQRYSEVSDGAPISLHDEEAGQPERRRQFLPRGTYGAGSQEELEYSSEHETEDENVVYPGPTDHTVFEGSGKYYARPEISTPD
jgi:hypothetical protein